MDTTTEAQPIRRRHGGPSLALALGAVAAVLAVSTLAYLGWANALPSPETVARKLPSPNGYDACYTAVQDLNSVSSVGPSVRTPWESDPADLRRDVEPKREDLDALRHTLRLPYLTPADLSDSDFNRLSEYRTACQMFAAEARLALLAGDRETALARSLDAIELGNKIGQGGPYLHNLVRITCQNLGIDAAERSFGPLSPDTARALGARMDRILSELPKAGDIADDERRMTLNFLRTMLAGRAPLSSSSSDGSEDLGLGAAKGRAVLFFYPKASGYRKVDGYWRAVAAELRKPYRLRTPPSAPLASDPVIGRAIGPGMRTSFTFTSMEAMLRVLRARLAVEEFRGRNDRLPASWDELSPAILPVAPEDPFSGESLRYLRQRNSYLLYSVGPDLRDDGGVPIAKRVSDDALGDYVSGKLIPGKQRGSARPAPGGP
jgi:hypothetical protein